MGIKPGDKINFTDERGEKCEGIVKTIHELSTNLKPCLTIKVGDREVSSIMHEDDRAESADGKKVNCYSGKCEIPKPQVPQTEAPETETITDAPTSGSNTGDTVEISGSETSTSQ